jgi:hypothetical protein
MMMKQAEEEDCRERLTTAHSHAWKRRVEQTQKNAFDRAIDRHLCPAYKGMVEGSNSR